MRLLSLLTVSGLLLFSACSKSSSSSSASKGTITIGSASYSVSQIADSTSFLTASEAGGNTVIFYFKAGSTPTSGTYDVVETANATNQVSISAVTYASGSFKFYDSGDSSGVKATVTINGNSKTIVLPQVQCTNSFNSSDKLMVSANITK